MVGRRCACCAYISLAPMYHIVLHPFVVDVNVLKTVLADVTASFANLFIKGRQYQLCNNVCYSTFPWCTANIGIQFSC